MKVALGQINTTIGDFAGNLRRMLTFAEKAEQRGAELIVFPEQAVAGYPAGDFLEQDRFIERNQETLDSLARQARGITIAAGFVARNPASRGRHLFNSAAILQGGKVVFEQHKTLLPTYDVFDEQRYFEPAEGSEVFDFAGQKVGIVICEDIWNDKYILGRELYHRNPVDSLQEKGCDLVLSLNASPYWLGKLNIRKELLAQVARRLKASVLHCNLVGGNDELIFDGGSCIVNADGQVVAQAGQFQEDLLICDISKESGDKHELIGDEAKECIAALELGIVDYFRKCGFQKATIGLSGGIDSALTATLAAQALGRQNVLGVLMPSSFTSQESIEDAKQLAARLGIATQTIPIEGLFDQYLQSLSAIFENREFDITEENLQARIRGNLLMAISNKFGSLVLSTGNKSELAVGYTTLYGDLSGGLAVLSDIPKTMVYKLAETINETREIIPKRILTKAPSAELRENQKDQDSLPAYELLDGILKMYIEEGLDRQDIIKAGFEKGMVAEVIQMIERNEYKRRQAPPGLKVTHKAFGSGRRLPIAQRFTS